PDAICAPRPRPPSPPGARSLLDLEDRQERLLRDLDATDLLHAPLALFLRLEELPLAGDVAAVALGGHVLPHRLHGLARDHLGPDRGLDDDLEHLTGDELAHSGGELAAARVRAVAVHDQRQRVDDVAVDPDVELHEVARREVVQLVVERGVALRDRLQAIVEVDDDLVQRQLVDEHDAALAQVPDLALAAALVLAELQDPAN